MIYWTPICGKYLLDCSILEKCGKIWKNGRFSGRLRSDWGNTTRAATAGLGSKGLNQNFVILKAVPIFGNFKFAGMIYLKR